MNSPFLADVPLLLGSWLSPMISDHALKLSYTVSQEICSLGLALHVWDTPDTQIRIIDTTKWWCSRWICPLLGGGFKRFLFSPLPGKMIPCDSYFSNGLKPPSSLIFFLDISRIWYFWWMIKVSQKILNLSVNTPYISRCLFSPLLGQDFRTNIFPTGRNHEQRT